MNDFYRRANYKSKNDVDRFILPLLDDQINQTLIELVKDQSEVELSLLDVGCGKQPFKEQIQKLGMKYFSSDIEQNEEKNLDFVFSIDKPLDEYHFFLKGKFSILLFSEVAEHVFDLDCTFKNLNLLTEVGGKVIFTSPFVYGLHEEPNDFWRLTPFAIERLAIENGFKVEKSLKLGDGWDVLGTLIGLNSIAPNGNSLLSKWMCFFVIKTRNFIWKILLSQNFRSRIKFSGSNEKLYLSNFFVFRKI